jgi:hypothetical protein
MTSDKTVTVEFELAPPVRYQLTTGVEGACGKIFPAPGTYDPGQTVSLTAMPDFGYRVKKWTGTNNDTSTANTNTVTMTSDKTVTVEFEPVPTLQYSLTATVPGGNGTVLPADGTFNSGEIVTLTATPLSGYRVKKWTGTDNDASTATTNTVTMTSDKAVTVEFEKIENETLLPSVSPTDTVTPTEPPTSAVTSGCFGTGALLIMAFCLAGLLLGVSRPE